jgi:hypothetical protein
VTNGSNQLENPLISSGVLKLLIQHANTKIPLLLLLIFLQRVISSCKYSPLLYFSFKESSQFANTRHVRLVRPVGDVVARCCSVRLRLSILSSYIAFLSLLMHAFLILLQHHARPRMYENSAFGHQPHFACRQCPRDMFCAISCPSSIHKNHLSSAETHDLSTNS